jgi:hypothetical protein
VRTRLRFGEPEPCRLVDERAKPLPLLGGEHASMMQRVSARGYPRPRVDRVGNA